MKIIFTWCVCLALLAVANCQESTVILPGAYQVGEYIPLLKGKKVALFANQTSVIGHTHLADTLRRLGVSIVKIFSPEHGFRGKADAGESVESYIDSATGIRVVSLYGNKTKPSARDIEDVDIMLFDIQDVGVRFYTYISSLQKYLESALENDKPLIILDRPNPNGFYVDGPVLDTAYKSFVGMQPVPVVYGMTIGEYAEMLLGEKWYNHNIIRKGGNNFRLTVIKCKGYTHKSKYILPVNPSPNLTGMGAVYWYPSTCFFEGTVLSEGRGTEHPFEIFGHPQLPQNLYAFTPHTTPGAKDPKFKGQLCYGWDLYSPDTRKTIDEVNGMVQIEWLIEAYTLFPDKSHFFTTDNPGNAGPRDYFFNKLAGSNELMEQIIHGKTEAEIRQSWQPKIEAFKKIRKKYLLYADFY